MRRVARFCCVFGISHNTTFKHSLWLVEAAEEVSKFKVINSKMQLKTIVRN